MSSVVYNTSAGKANVSELFPTTISTAAKIYRYQHIMPAPLASNESGSSAAPGSIKTRKYTPRGSALSAAANGNANANASSAIASNALVAGAASSAPYNVDQSQSVQRRNARERNRVKQVNNSFSRLRQHIPQSIIADLTKGGGRGPHKKISKVDTLRIAVEYIRRLQDLVDDLNGGPSSSAVPFAVSNLCLDETSSSSSGSCSDSGSASASSFIANGSSGQLAPLYYSSALAAASTINTTTTNPLQQQQQLARQQYPNHPLTPISLNAYSPPQSNLLGVAAVSTVDSAGCHSPTSSFNSSMSFDSGTYEAAPQQLSPPAAADTQPQSSHLDAHLQLKFEPYEHFNLDEEDCTPDDEEILDYISLWQEQ